LGTCLGIKSSLNSGIRCLPVTGVENPFLLGMQSSELSAILRSTVSRLEDGLELQIANPLHRLKLQLEVVFAMFHLDYLSCLLTVLATILLARKSWVGLFVAIFNSLIVCAIGLRTSQLGFIPANLFCICVYAFSMRPWLKEQTDTNRDNTQRVRAARLLKTRSSPPYCGSGQQFERPCCKTPLYSIRFQPSPSQSKE
jgi:hypothetical protein